MAQLEEGRVYGTETFHLHKTFGNGKTWISDQEIIDYMLQSKQNADVDWTIAGAVRAIEQNKEDEEYHRLYDFEWLT